jgi:high-affinity iron transporter
MLASAIIVFREVLEAALLIGIMAAAVGSIQNARIWIAAGVAAGLLASLVVAGLADFITQAAEGAGQELLNATVLGLAVLMLAWHNIWMSIHGRELARQARDVARTVATGHAELSAVALVVCFTVLREGSETALFLYGLSAGNQLPMHDLVLGAALGLASGAIAGATVYWGLVRIPVARLFSVTSALLLLVAAGMASQMARLLSQANLLEAGSETIWDSSWMLSMDSHLGTLLHLLMGYEARPSAMQVTFYFATIFLILCGMQVTNRLSRTSSPTRHAMNSSRAPI